MLALSLFLYFSFSHLSFVLPGYVGIFHVLLGVWGPLLVFNWCPVRIVPFIDDSQCICRQINATFSYSSIFTVFCHLFTFNLSLLKMSLLQKPHNWLLLLYPLSQPLSLIGMFSSFTWYRFWCLDLNLLSSYLFPIFPNCSLLLFPPLNWIFFSIPFFSNISYS